MTDMHDVFGELGKPSGAPYFIALPESPSTDSIREELRWGESVPAATVAADALTAKYGQSAKRIIQTMYPELDT